MIVIDLGCAVFSGVDSTRLLIGQFHPGLLYGFDPLCPVVEGRHHEGTWVVLSGRAAWTHDGTVAFQDDGVASCVVVDGEPLLQHAYRLNPGRPREVECFDLAAFILDLPSEEIVLKADCEAAELTLLEHLLATGAHKRLTRALVEFHPGASEDWERRARIEAEFACPILDWGR